MDLVREKGLFSFYEDGHGECCRIRKVTPALLSFLSACCASRGDKLRSCGMPPSVTAAASAR